MAAKKRTKRDLPKPTDEQDEQLLASIEQPGWHVIGIEEDGEGPAFAYSIGLFHSFNHPEVIAFGLPVRVMHGVINGIGEAVRSDQRFDHLDEASDILEGYSVF